MKARYKISCAVAAILSGYAGAAAADTAALSSGVEEITVTAERRAESVQNVPMTIQAFTGQTLTDLNVTTLDAILKYTPNVTYANNGPGQGNIYMRGLSNGFAGNQSSATVGNFPNVAVYLDDEAMQFPLRNLDIYMVDMDRIEVLEGPQGTLFGGGAEAGALRYITNKPVLDETSGNVQVGYGITHDGGDNSSANATLNIPLIDDTLAVRLVVYDERQGGYIDNVPATFTRSNSDLGNGYFGIGPTAGKCPNGLPAGPAGLCSPPNSGQVNNYSIAEKNSNPVTYTGFRASELYKVNTDWDVLISETYQDMDAEGLSVEYPYASDYPTGAPNQVLAPLQVTSFVPSYEKDSYFNASWTVNGKIDDIKIVYTGAYLDRRIKEQMDYTNYSRSSGGMYYQCVGGSTGWSAAGAPASNYCYSPIGYWQDTVQNTHITEELRASTPDDWRFRAIVGAYWEDFQIDDVMNFNYKTLPACNAQDISTGTFCVGNVATLPGTTANDPGVRSNSTAFGEDTQRGYDQAAFFGSFDYDIIPNVLTVTGGTRWYQYSEFEVGSQYETGTGCADILVCTSDDTNINAERDKKVYTGHKSRGNITWHVDDDTMLYFTYSEGFRPGGFNRAGGDVAPLDVPSDCPGVAAKKCDFQYDKPRSYTPDSLTNYEVGAKAQFFEHRLQLNLSAYDMRWADTQLLFFNPTELGNTTFGVNGPNYIVKGVELQAVAEPIDGLSIQGSGSYNDAEQSNSPCLIDNVPGSVNLNGVPEFGKCINEIYQKGVGSNQPFQNPFGLIGSTPAFSPKYAANLRARYDWVVGNYNAFAMVGGNYMGSMYNQPATYVSGTGVVVPNTTYLRYLQSAYATFDASFGVARDKWTFQVYGNNLFNSHSSVFTSSTQFIKSEVPLRPMVLGVKLGYTF